MHLNGSGKNDKNLLPEEMGKNDWESGSVGDSGQATTPLSSITTGISATPLAVFPNLVS